MLSMVLNTAEEEAKVMHTTWHASPWVSLVCLPDMAMITSSNPHESKPCVQQKPIPPATLRFTALQTHCQKLYAHVILDR